METKRLSFALDGDQIDYKSYSQKDFLELSMKAISDANPNRNNSWFTRESIEKAIASGTCKNKPVLGYFENDDFVSHNGAWKKDSETGVSYWDTLGTKGERILGVIREKDEVVMTEDSKGQTWLCFSCALWVQYGFKQVKRLLKDARRAKNNGGSTKNVSDEVAITNYEELPNGVMKINEFNLVGVTILGSRNGTKVEPGIDGADLSVVDFMGKDAYERQMQGLRLAYEKLDGPVDNKEVFGNMEQNELNNTNESFASNENSDLGTTPAQTTETGVDSNSIVNQESTAATFEEDCHANEENTNAAQDGDSNEDLCPVCGKNPCECANHANENANESANEDCHNSDEGAKNEDGTDTPNDDNCGANCQNDCGDAKYEELQAKYDALAQELDEYKSNYEKLTNENVELQTKVAAFEQKEFLNKAANLIASATGLTEDQNKKFYADCESGEIKDLEDLKTKVAVAIFENTKKVVEENTSSFEADVYTPTTTVEDSKTEKLSRWERMKKNVNKE